jgi:penicillin-binding protein 2
MSPHSPHRSDATVRLWLLRLATLLVFGILVGQLALMQFVRGASFQAEATFNRVREVLSEGERGVLYDRDGRILARNTARFGVAVVPAELPDDPDYTVSQARRHALYADLLQVIEESLAVTAPLTATLVGGAPAGSGPLPAAYFAGANLPAAPRPLSSDEIDAIVSQREAGSAFQPVLVADNLPREAALRIEEQRYRLPGVELQLRSTREYPFGADVSHLVGYMGPIPEETRGLYAEKGYPADSWVGWTGLEFSFEASLRGQSGRRVIEVDVNGRERATLGDEIPPRPGNNLILSLDMELQTAMRQALVAGVTPKRSEGAVAVALDPRDGFVLGMVSLPAYDNNIFADGITEQEYTGIAEARGRPLVNHAIAGIYPPGSTFKLVPAAGGLEDQVITARTLLSDPGIIYLPNRYAPDDPNLAQPFVCWIYKLGGAHGDITVREALGESCDVFFYKLGGGWPLTNFDGMGIDALAAYARQFGFGQPSGIDLPGENPGLIPDSKWKRVTKGERWVTGDTYNMAIGQGDVLATPLQVGLMTMAVANGGALYRPQLVAAVTDAEGRLVQRSQPELIRQVPVSAKHLAVVREGMWMTVNASFGTAPNAALADVTVAGKTGTAEFFDPRIPRDGKGNLPTHAWFTAFAPYEAPEIVVTVFVYNGGEGSATAVPIARAILRTYFDLQKRDAETGSHSILDQLEETPTP